MTIKYQKKRALFGESATIDDADVLWDWLMQQPQGSVDLSACTYLHTVILQLLMAARVKISAWPANPELQLILETALTPQGE